MVSLVNCHTKATRIGWHLWEIDLIFAPGLPPGWRFSGLSTESQGQNLVLTVLNVPSPLSPWYEPVNFGAGKSLVPPRWRDQSDATVHGCHARVLEGVAKSQFALPSKVNGAHMRGSKTIFPFLLAGVVGAAHRPAHCADPHTRSHPRA